MSKTAVFFMVLLLASGGREPLIVLVSGAHAPRSPGYRLIQDPRPEGIPLLGFGGLGWLGRHRRGDRLRVLLALHHVRRVGLFDRLLGAGRVHRPARLG